MVELGSGNSFSGGGEEWTAEASRRKFVISLVLLGIALLLVMVRFACRAEDKPGEIDQRLVQMDAAAYVLGMHLESELSRGRALLLTEAPGNPDFRAEVVDNAVQGIEKGSFDKIQVAAIDHPKLPARYQESYEKRWADKGERPAWYPSLEHWFSWEVFQRVVRAHPECDLVVSLIGVPVDWDPEWLARVHTGRMTRFAVLAGPLRDQGMLDKGLRAGFVTGAVRWHPCPEANGHVPAGATDDAREVFAKHCCLFTPESVKEEENP